MRGCRPKTLLLVACLVGWIVAPAVPAQDRPAPDAPAGHSSSPDPGVPAMETFADWPPDSLRTRAYWLPWSSGAFQRASMFGRPVFVVLSVNWNRASQRLKQETLASPDVLRTLNAGYVSISVNADLRPDVRMRYETGAWPAALLLLPTGWPILAQAQTRNLSIAKPIRLTRIDEEAMRFFLSEGTIYWSRWARLLFQVGEDWAEQDTRVAPSGGIADAQASERLERWLLGNADRVGGGFGAAPKFVIPWLDEYAAKLAARGRPDLAAQSRLTLEALASSPLFDEVEGGLHRAAVAPGYRGIEYEKMLSGNAAYVRDLTYALRSADSAELREALAATADFLVNVLGREGGGFYLAQVADASSADGGGYWRAAPDARPAPPPIDRIALTGPNALAGVALLRAGWLLEREDLRQAGRAALEFVRENAYRPGRGVTHAIEPESARRTFLTAQADTALAFVEAYELTGEASHLELAREIVDFALANLRSSDEVALRDHLVPPGAVGLVTHPRWPMRANARLARAMLRLEACGAGERYRNQAIRLLDAFSIDLAAFAMPGIELGVAIEETIQDPIVVRIAGAAGDPRTDALRAAALNARSSWTIVTTAEAASEADRPSAQVRRGAARAEADGAAALATAIERLAAAPAEGNR